MAGLQIAGYDIQDLVNTFNQDCVKNAQKCLNYLDGKQEEELKHVLSTVRKKWQQRGILPRTRNITEAVVAKSAQLFKDAPPVMDVYETSQDTPDLKETAMLQQVLNKIEFSEILINLDQVVRLLKTGILLLSFDKDSDELLVDILHRANCTIVTDPIYKKIILMMYKVNTDAHGNSSFRVYTSDQIYDVISSATNNVSLVGQQDNPFSMIPIVEFYDTKKPRTGFWVEPRMDLVGINELYNLHITDAEFVIRYMKSPTVYSNFEVQADSLSTMEPIEVYKQSLPRLMNTTVNGVLGGPDQFVKVNLNGETPFVHSIAPDVKMGEIDLVINNWVNAYAHDWSVSLKDLGDSGNAKANSGFQLIVMEIPNLELRQTRQRMFESGFKRFFDVFKVIYNTYHPLTFSDTSKLYVGFKDVKLPVDFQEEEQTWDLRIQSNRASIVDYCMEFKGMNRDEAIAKAEEIKQFNTQFPPTIPLSPDGSKATAQVGQNLQNSLNNNGADINNKK